MSTTFFISGIDTDAGKSYATGFLARRWAAEGRRVVTMKLIQTGCPEGEMSEDILTHRRLMGIPLLPEDRDGTTCPIRLPYPASPDLAARMAGVTIDFQAIARSIDTLSARYDTLLIEGAGGLMTPIEGAFTMLDWASQAGFPMIFVTNPRLGSISQTLLGLEACRYRWLRVAMLVYNRYGESAPEITDDTRAYLKRRLPRLAPGCKLEEMPVL